jgi:catechol 2,3-dioxygenase-like lactoylglutathione lyase family enzyme
VHYQGGQQLGHHESRWGADPGQTGGDAASAGGPSDRVELSERAWPTSGPSTDRRARGVEFLTPPLDRRAELRCYIRDPDGYLIEIGEATGMLAGVLARTDR